MLEVRSWEAALDAWLEPFLDALGHKARRRWAPVYIRGLYGRTERKSVQPIAAALTPGDYDQLHNFIASRSWDTAPLEPLLARTADQLVGGPDAILAIDDTAVLKKGEHSVGVAAQYAGVVGKTANCQVLVTLTLARREVPVPMVMRLFLPEEWTSKPDRCRRAQVPEAQQKPRTKPELAIEEVDRVLALGVRFGCVVADAGYGHGAPFRHALSQRGLAWAVGVTSTQAVYATTVSLTWPVATTGRPRKRAVASEKPVTAQAMLKTAVWRRLTWRTGTKGPLTAHFAAVRVRVADGPRQRGGTPLPGDEVWLVGERRGSGETKYYLSNLPPDTPLRTLASWIKARWVCEQGHQQMKEELGLDHFEGRSWSGLHHHALLVMIALAFLQHLRLAAAPEWGKKAKAQQRTAAATDAARRAPSHSRAHPSDGTDPMSVLSVLARSIQAGVELPK
ncbi:IS701 family transposase [Azospirillum canadense]|uniref:IS701 family transposase n=1 Tax=Azospirillum canadense TaxID=403962 RepID=UPI00222799F8|nr:IS701 family transposase [Azospirillum canadense]MCW2242371.1 SRSO17 transposase [Azospirillum canadense]MCW2242477.1 SRSO17 transposase [Azospirillum canadense]